jgi:hypothetical protein
MTAENKTQREPHDWEKFHQYGALVSLSDAQSLVNKGSTDALPGFMGETRDARIKRTKKGRIKSATVKGTQVREGDIHSATVNLTFPGLFARGLAKIARKSRASLDVTEARNALTLEQLNDPDSTYKALYDKGEDDGQ